MTAPVRQQPSQDSWVVSFTMPASCTLETLLEPVDSQVTLRQVPARRAAALRYSGFWNERSFLLHKMQLEPWVRSRELGIAGDPTCARYHPPFAILVPVDAGARHGTAQ